MLKASLVVLISDLYIKMKLFLFVILNIFIPSNSEWICDKNSGKCKCNGGVCNMNGQTYYTEYVCTTNAQSC